MLFLIAKLAVVITKQMLIMMNKEDILKKIGNILQELNEQHGYLSATKDLNILELELFTANADFLLDHIEIFKKLNEREHNFQLPELAATPVDNVDHQEVAELELVDPVVEEIEFEEPPVVEESRFKFDFSEPADLTFDFEKSLDVEDVFDRQLTYEEQELLEKKKQAEQFEPILENDDKGANSSICEEEVKELTESDTEMPLSVPVPPVVTERKVWEPPLQAEETIEEPKVVVEPQLITKETTQYTQVADQPKEEPLKRMSLNEILSAQRESKTSVSKPITDLKSVISLNDKMLFIRELFNGYNLAYSEAIEILNRFDTFEAADNFLLKNYADKNNWSQKQATVDRLYEILNRKFKS